MLGDEYIGEVKQELLRMAGLDYFPAEEKAVAELQTALMNADSMEIVKLVVDDWLAGSSARPTPVDLRIAVHAENDRRVPSKALQEIDVWKALQPPPGSPRNRLELLLEEHRILLQARIHEKHVLKNRTGSTELSQRLSALTEQLRTDEGSGRWLSCQCTKH